MQSGTLGTFVVSLLLVIISILSIIGLYWLTKFSFTSKKDEKNKDSYTVTNFTATGLTLSRMTVVLTWIQICLTIVGALWAVSYLK